MEVPSIFLNNILREGAKKKARSIDLTVGSTPVLRIKNNLSSFEEEILNKDQLDKVIQSFLNKEELDELYKNKE
ncbi:hypothetical protein K8R62_01800, partial [bacterium]|nr:hypothetical protein [bacterium]